MRTLPEELQIEIAGWLYRLDDCPFTLKRDYVHGSHLLPLSRTSVTLRTIAVPILFRTVLILDVSNDILQRFVEHHADVLRTSCHILSIYTTPQAYPDHIGSQRNYFLDYRVLWNDDLTRKSHTVEGRQQASTMDDYMLDKIYQQDSYVWRRKRMEIARRLLRHSNFRRLAVHFGFEDILSDVGDLLDRRSDDHLEFIHTSGLGGVPGRPMRAVPIIPNNHHPSNVGISFSDRRAMSFLKALVFENSRLTTLTLELAECLTFPPTLACSIRRLMLTGFGRGPAFRQILRLCAHSLEELDLVKMWLRNPNEYGPQFDTLCPRLQTLHLSPRTTLWVAPTVVAQRVKKLVVWNTSPANPKMVASRAELDAILTPYPSLACIQVYHLEELDASTMMKTFSELLPKPGVKFECITIRDPSRFHYLGQSLLDGTPWDTEGLK